MIVLQLLPPVASLVERSDGTEGPGPVLKEEEKGKREEGKEGQEGRQERKRKKEEEFLIKHLHVRTYFVRV